MNQKPIKLSSYIRKKLLPDEYVIYKLKPSWKIWILPAIILSLIVLDFCICIHGRFESMLVALATIGVTIFVLNFVMVLNEYFKSLFLTNKRIIIENFREEIDLREIKSVAIFEIGPGELPHFWLILGGIFFYDITFYCKDNESLIVRMANIDKEDYNQFKKLLTEECKKHGNKIS